MKALKQQAVEKDQCVILSDYPIKTIGYIKILASLGETDPITYSATPPKNTAEAHRCPLLIIDMNWLPEDEDILSEYILENFSKAQVLFMKEDSTQHTEQTHQGRSVCFLGKLCSLNTSKACIEQLLKKARAEKPETTPIV